MHPGKKTQAALRGWLWFLSDEVGIDFVCAPTPWCFSDAGANAGGAGAYSSRVVD